MASTMEVMEFLFGENDNTSGEELGEDGPKGHGDFHAHRENSHPHYSKFVSWGRQGQTLNSSVPQVPYKFYLLDCDTCAYSRKSETSQHHNGNCAESRTDSEHSNVTSVSDYPIFRLYGLDEENRSVCCFVRGFKPYFFANPTNVFTEDDIQLFQESLNLAVQLEIKRNPGLHYLASYARMILPIVSVEMVQDPDSENILGYHPSKLRPQNEAATMLRVNCSLTAFVRIAAEALRKGKVSCPYVDGPCEYNVYETNLNPVVRFLTSHNISCCTWIEIRGNILSPVEKRSYAQVELITDHEQINAVSEDINVSLGIPKLRILSFDIECLTRPPEFIIPRHGSDQVIQISSVLRLYGDEAPLVQVVFTLDTCDPLPNAEILSFDTEEAMLEAWRLFVILTDPDIITGYNINKFDIPFLLDRARRLDIEKFMYLGRLINTPSGYRRVRNDYPRKYIDPWAEIVPYIRGRVVIDMLPVMRQLFPGESSFKLASVSARFLGCSKGDVHYTEIHELQSMSSAGRKRLAEYCLQDSWLVAELLLKKPLEVEDENSKASFIQHYCEKAKSSGSLLRYVVSKSNGYNSYFKAVRKHKNPDLVFQPVTPVSRKRVASIPVSRLDKVRRALFQEESSGNDSNAQGPSNSVEQVSQELPGGNRQS